ncbi:MAG: 1-aminocyclopropane-1-carboxylate deaminase/D-cysteine desulfhydrase [Promethearchaeota archaeon]
MEREEPILFREYLNLKNKVPWIPLLTNIPTPVERLAELEKHLDLHGGEIYIKRDDINHYLYGGNKIRKFEFIFGNAVKKKKRGIITVGGIGTNHGLACAIISKELNQRFKCQLFLFPQPLTWHVQRSLLLFDYFGAKIHICKGDVSTFIQAMFFKLIHPKYYFMFPGGSPLFGFGSPLGMIGFINAIFELREQIKSGEVPEPDMIFIAGGSTGTAAGLVAGCKLLGLKTRVAVVAVYADFIANSSAVAKNASKALKYLHKRDKNIPKIKIIEDDFDFIKGYLGSEYGIKTIRGQKAVDLLYDLEGKRGGFKLETTYTGKAMAGMLDYLKEEKNKSKKVLFWNTYNSNDLDKYLKETGFNYKKLHKKLHKFFVAKRFQCWQITDCPEKIKKNCSAYYNHEYRFWNITDCFLEKEKREKAKRILNRVIKLEDA